MANTLSLDSEQLLGLIFLPGSPTRTQIEKLWHNIKYERVQYIYLATIERSLLLFNEDHTSINGLPGLSLIAPDQAIVLPSWRG